MSGPWLFWAPMLSCVFHRLFQSEWNLSAEAAGRAALRRGGAAELTLTGRVL